MDKIQDIIADIEHEVRRARSLHRPMNSAHEAYAVILEEVDELWEEIKKQEAVRCKQKIRTEAIQAAAMCVRFIHDVIDDQ